jgi:uncharacterized protein YdaU (DUF1376 family)
MAEAPIWPVATDALVADTMALDAEQTGAYVMLLMCLWRAPEARLPLDHNKLARMARVSARRWAKVWSAISDFFTVEAGLLSQKRVTSDRLKVREKIRVARENGERGGRPKAWKNNEASEAHGFASVSKSKTQAEPNDKLSMNHIHEPYQGLPVVPPRRDKAQQKTPLPDGFPDADALAAAETYWQRHSRFDLSSSLEAEAFRAWCLANGKRYADWPAAWQTRYVNALRFNPARRPSEDGRSALMKAALR